MRILLLVQKSQRIILDRLYDAIVEGAAERGGHCDLRRLDAVEQADLKGYFSAHVELQQYDRIVLMLRFKKEIKQRRFLRTVPNIVILEHDACQNYINGKYRNEYSRHYRAIPWVRVLCSGFMVTQRLRAEGFDVVFVPKGYDQSLLRNLQQPRHTELAFIGSTGNKLYHQRKLFLEKLQEVEPLEVARTQSGAEYLKKLNDVQFFVSADIGIGEYMIKNFEAMACGCVLLAWDQGAEENSALGLVDMENVVLYQDQDTLRHKLNILRADPGRAAIISAAGQHLVERQLNWAHIGRLVVDALEPPLRNRADYRSWWRKLFDF